MEAIPDDVWHLILQINIQKKRLDHVDLCSLAIVNGRFDQLTQDPDLWAILLSRDFPSSVHFYEAPSKALYRVKREEVRWKEFWQEYLDESLREFRSRLFCGRSCRTIDFHLPSQLNSRPQFRSDETIICEYLDPNSHKERDPVLPQVGEPSLRRARNCYYENKQRKRFDNSSNPKVNIPKSKSYIPMNRPPHRSMPRKI